MAVQLIEDGDAQAFRWEADGKPYAFRSDARGDIDLAFRKAVAEGVARGDAVLDPVEREVARTLETERLGLGPELRKDAKDTLFIGWQVDSDNAFMLAQAITNGVGTQLGNVAPQDMHMTLLYLGDPDADGSGPWDVQLVAAVCKLFSTRWCQLSGTITGFGRFVGSEDSDILLALLDIPDLENFRRALRDDLICYGAIPYNSPLFNQEHGFVPHITLANVPKEQGFSATFAEPIPVTLDNVTFYSEAGVAAFPLTDGAMLDQDMAAPYYMARAEAERAAKSGRVLSGANLQKLEDAIAAMQNVVEAERKRQAKGKPEDGEEEGAAEKAGEPLTYVVEKSADEKRYTLGPLYAPQRKDAHGEFVEAEVLQQAVWDYVRESAEQGRRLNLQHGDFGDVQVGEWVEVMAWPYEHTIKVAVPGKEAVEVDMPADTVYMGVIWDEDAWPLVKSGKLTGLSLGGRAVRVGVPDADLEHMGYKHAAKAHKFAGAEGAPCEICGKTWGDGEHYGNAKHAAEGE